MQRGLTHKGKFLMQRNTTFCIY